MTKSPFKQTGLPSKSTALAASNQHARFLETARALGCDEDEAAFNEKLKAVVGPKPKAKPKQVTDATVISQMLRRFEKTGTDASGWIVDYRDPQTDAIWQLTYPQGQMHGGGPPLLTRID